MASDQAKLLEKVSSLYKRAQVFDSTVLSQPSSSLTKQDTEPLHLKVEEAQKQLKEIYKRIEIAEAGKQHHDISNNQPLEVLRSRAESLQAEVDQQIKRSPSGFYTHPPLLMTLLKKHLETEISSLHQTLATIRSQRLSCEQHLNRVQAAISEERYLMDSVEKELKDLSMDQVEEMLSEENIRVRKLKDKLKETKALQQLRSEQMADFLSKNFPLPDEDCIRKYSEEYSRTKTGEIPRIKTVAQMLEVFVNKSLNTPHDPWVTEDESLWPPYIELLLRSGIIVRHKDNCHIFRLESFLT
ncbi:centromere protein K-like [Limulus polyphemus]|uniref:Centromere protein K-like n=1 Tax=Limulus polyphemus TaxID=6850 RepID=A0ABM1SSG9_LIMPO|nr:centromere protein K-like [Limulus polyphemus]